MKYSVIFSVCNSGDKERDQWRYKHFVFCIQHWLRQIYQDYEIIVVDQIIGKTPFFDSVVLPLDKVKYITIKYPKYNRCWSMNVGAKEAKGDHLLFVDGDVLVNIDYLNELKCNWDFGLGWSKLIKLNQDNTILSIGTPSLKGYSGSINIFERDFYFNKVYGHNESMFWGGGTNTELYIRACFVNNVPFKEVPCNDYTIYHLWHPAKKYDISLNDFRDIIKFTEDNPYAVNQMIAELGIGDFKPSFYVLDDFNE